MDDFNPVLSNGTCWSNVNVRALDDFIPCGNDAGRGQHFACCNRGDNCLSSNACYNGKYGITYIAGCTDAGFASASCPKKGNFYDQQWVGLVRCMVSDDDTENEEEWAGCKESSGKGGLGVPSKCDCRGKIPLFKDNPTLTNIAHLPLGSGETISYFPGFEPTSAADTPTELPTISSTETPAGQSSTTEPTDSPVPATPPATPTPTTPADAGLSPAAQAGIGVGAGGGGLIIACLIVIAILLRRRKKKDDEGHPAPALPTTTTQYYPPSLPRDESSLADPSLSGFKPELAADEPKNNNNDNNNNNTNNTSLSLSLSSPAEPSPNSPNPSSSPLQFPPHHQHQHQHQHQQRYQAYNPETHGDYAHRHSDVSDMSSTMRDGSGRGLPSPGPVITPQGTGAPPPPPPPSGEGGDARPGQPPMEPIHELQG